MRSLHGREEDLLARGFLAALVLIVFVALIGLLGYLVLFGFPDFLSFFADLLVDFDRFTVLFITILIVCILSILLLVLFGGLISPRTTCEPTINEKYWKKRKKRLIKEFGEIEGAKRFKTEYDEYVSEEIWDDAMRATLDYMKSEHKG